MDEDIVEPQTIYLSRISLVNFRCFKQLTLDIQSPYVLLEGPNGIGKTSILEALYYACYLRSFRTHNPRELISFGAHEFFVKINLDTHNNLEHVLQIGFSQAKRLVKIDQKVIHSYKDLMRYYRIISITENDLEIVQGSPQSRRLFLDQMLVLLDASYGKILKGYRHIVDQRNALLQQKDINNETYDIMTHQVWQQAHEIQERREQLLNELVKHVNEQGTIFLDKFFSITCIYRPKRSLEDDYESFKKMHPRLMEQEYRLRRTLFGAHLDDVLILSKDRECRFFASRGQQKQIIILLKIAQLKILLKKGISSVCLLDDFMTDFDPVCAIALVDALKKLGTQLIFTTPLQESPMANHLLKTSAQSIKLT